MVSTYTLNLLLIRPCLHSTTTAGLLRREHNYFGFTANSERKWAVWTCLSGRCGWLNHQGNTMTNILLHFHCKNKTWPTECAIHQWILLPPLCLDMSEEASRNFQLTVRYLLSAKFLVMLSSKCEWRPNLHKILKADCCLSVECLWSV